MRLLPQLSFLRAALVGGLVSCVSLAPGCMQATQTYALVLLPGASLGSAWANAQTAAGGSSPSLMGSHIEPASPEASATSGTLPTAMVGSLSVERIEGGRRLVVLQLEQLPPPERIAPGLREFVVWLEDPRGGEVNMGTLHYDRANHSGSLLATTDLTAFTIRVTGERDARAAVLRSRTRGRASTPSGVLLAERRVVIN